MYISSEARTCNVFRERYKERRISLERDVQAGHYILSLRCKKEHYKKYLDKKEVRAKFKLSRQVLTFDRFGVAFKTGLTKYAVVRHEVRGDYICITGVESYQFDLYSKMYLSLTRARYGKLSESLGGPIVPVTLKLLNIKEKISLLESYIADFDKLEVYLKPMIMKSFSVLPNLLVGKDKRTSDLLRGLIDYGAINRQFAKINFKIFSDSDESNETYHFLKLPVNQTSSEIKRRNQELKTKFNQNLKKYEQKGRVVNNLNDGRKTFAPVMQAFSTEPSLLKIQKYHGRKCLDWMVEVSYFLQRYTIESIFNPLQTPYPIYRADKICRRRR